MMMYESNKMKRNRAGLVLLIVLGMLAMFSLLAVTYVVTASSSISGSQAIKRRVQNSRLDLEQMGAADKVLRQLLRGTNDQNSVFYTTGNLLGDIYGPDPIRTTPASYFSADAVIHYAVPAAGDGSTTPPTPADPERNVNLVKLSLNRDAEFNGPLSDMENDYNSRLLTFTEGPLTGQSFRILKYVGKADRTTLDPNTATLPELPWRPNLGVAPDALSIQYSVLIDLNEVVNMRVTGEVLAGDGTIRSVSRGVIDWIAEFGAATLFYAKTTLAPPSAANMVGYKLIINDAAFNYPGIGIEDIAVVPNAMNQPTAVPGFGNIDARRLLRTSRPISPAILPHYDYLKDNLVMATNLFNAQVGVEGVGSRRTDHRELRLYGASNEGIDVPDYRDMFLAHQTAFNGAPSITPSFHRPAVINHISHVFGNPSALTAGDVAELLRLIDASTGRIMSVRFGSLVASNPRFAPHADYPNLNMLTWSTPPTPAEINTLRAYVLRQINGPWDVDNDGDGMPDSVWVDPGLGIVYSPDGRRLRPLVSLLVQDLDSRINLNVAGDRSHTLPNFDAPAFPGVKRTGTLISQGMGTGPADISLRTIFTKDEQLDGTAYGLPVQMVGLTQSGTNTFSFFDELYGARRYKGAKHPSINYFDGTLDRVPGKHGPLFANDPISQVNEREQHLPFSNARMPGLPLGRRGSVGMTFDMFGNPVMANPSPIDGNPYSYGNPAQLSETMDDPYDRNAMTATASDDPLGLEDLEVILRRYDADVQAYPSRIRDMFNKFNLQAANSYGNVAAINREVTTRSAELRHPPMGAAFKTVRNFGSGDVVAVESGAPSYVHFIQMLHSQRYRTVAYPPSAADDPGLTYAAISELFPMEFSKGLKMDLNRPFGNGFDSNGNGDIDEPIELTSFENEVHPVATTAAPFVGAVNTRASFPSNTSDASVGRNNPENEQSSYGKDVAQVVRTSGNTGFRSTALRGAQAGRQMLARNLYCLAQLIIPKDFVFDGMNINTMTQYQLAAIRAKAIAQWAVNVVDYRDTDSVMTRFEYDVLPFGAGAGIGTPAGARPAYWAPDHALETVSGVNNRVYIGVVWGMEMPELLLTETMAYHDKKLKDTNMDNSSRPQALKINDVMDPNSDDSLDQYRFPDAGLLIELFVNRSTGPINDPTFAGTPSLYTNIGGERRLNLSRLAPPSVAWGQQPVWRIAISDIYGATHAADHPQTRMVAGTAATLTHQQSTEPAVAGQTDPARTGEANISQTSVLEQHLGNGFHYEIGGPPTMARGFDRFVWFTNQRPAPTQLIPDMLPANAGAADRCVYVAQSPSVEVPGGSYLVVGPKYRIPFGSLTHNQFRGTAYPARVLQADMTDTALRPIYSPSLQRINLEANTVSTRLMNDTAANEPWLTNIRPPFSVICTAEAPSAAWRDNGSGRPRIFRDGVGLNISYPNPVTTNPYWAAGNLPTQRLNSADTSGSRRDDTPGFADEDAVLPDSWVDLANVGTERFPDVPIDRSNTVLTANNMYPSGTYQNVRAAYLQRLADPDVPYDPTFNPYITVDWMSIDLTVFNGESSREMDARDSGPPGAMFAPNPPPPRDILFASRYKTGELVTSPGSGNGVSYLSPISRIAPNGVTRAAVQTALPMLPPRPEVNAGTPAVPTNPESFFPFSLGHERLVSDWGRVGNTTVTFGYLNAGDLVSQVNATNEPHSDEVSTASNQLFEGFGRPIGNAANPYFAGAGEYMASPLWANRQFATPYEIMMVPHSSPAQFGMHYAVRRSGPEVRDQYTHLPKYQQMNQWFVDVPLPASADLGSTTDQWQNTAKYWGNPFNGPRANRQADWALLFDFIETAPLFADAHTHWRPDVMSHLANRNSVAARFLNSFIPQGYYLPDGSDAQGYRGPSFLAPFNSKPSYVAAGKINVNTVAVSQRNPGARIRSHALKALETLYYTGNDRNQEYGDVSDAFAAAFVENRRGYATPVGPNAFFGTVVNQELHPDYPTQFVGAYRSALSANLAPILPDPVANARMRQRHGVETTLLRTLDLGGSNPVLTNTPMLLNRPGTTDHVNVTQPYDYYQRAIRLPNLVSNQSNVFAVWMTVGLFEYDPLTGYGEEYVNEAGGVQRERRFYIIDRSTPVGYKQGEDLNVKKTVLLERKIP
ncbi:MAG: hypothetical protein MUC43_06870 [Pirellula sp.]|nr:hypothetical protein [Pirellula sp.]